MDFTFSQDQLLFQEEVQKFLVNEVTPDAIRALWDTESGRSANLWSQLTELGLTGMTVPEQFGGLGLSIVDFILLAQCCGYVALPEPLVHTVMVAVPTLLKLDNEALNEKWLPKIAAGEAMVIVALEDQEFIEDAHLADLFLIEDHGVIYAFDPEHVTTRHNESVDPSRRLFVLEYDIEDGEKLLADQAAHELADFAFYSGALGVAAQALGLAQRMIDMSVTYTSERKQFGKAIGSFQAVKHHMANVAYKLEYAKAPVYRAAYALAKGDSRSALYVSHAKIASVEAADLAAKNSIQVHGAMGYTWEVDLHIYMKKAWAFRNTWGDMAFLKNRVADAVLVDDAKIGAGNTFI